MIQLLNLQTKIKSRCRANENHAALIRCEQVMLHAQGMVGWQYHA